MWLLEIWFIVLARSRHRRRVPIVKILEKIDLGKTIEKLEKELGRRGRFQAGKTHQALELFEIFAGANNIRPEWMVLFDCAGHPAGFAPDGSLEADALPLPI